MVSVFVFFSKDICDVNMWDCNDVNLDAFLDSTFFCLKMSKAFGSWIKRSMDTGLIVIVDWYSCGREMEIFKEMLNSDEHLVHSSVAYIFSSAELQAVIFWRLDDHMTEPFASMMR